MKNDLPTVLTCRSQHQLWASSLTQSEEEIDQLLTLLADLPTTYNSLTPPDAYTTRLSRLKESIQQVRHEVVCAGTACSTTPTPVSCTDSRFVPIALADSLVAGLAHEYSRVKERCQAFLAELMRLNLI